MSTNNKNLSYAEIVANSRKQALTMGRTSSPNKQTKTTDKAETPPPQNPPSYTSVTIVDHSGSMLIVCKVTWNRLKELPSINSKLQSP